MLLMDQIALHGSDITVRNDDGSIEHLPGSRRIAESVRNAPVRYSLGDAAFAIVEATLGTELQMLAKSRTLFRMPARRFWIEWVESEAAAAGSSRQRVGVLVECDEDCQAGEMQIAWSENKDTTLAQAAVRFDLHGDGSPPDFTHILPANTCLCPHLANLIGSLTVRLAPEWRDYFNKRGGRNDTSISRDIFRNIWREPLRVYAFALLLQAKGSPLGSCAADIHRLNLARAKRGKPAMLDRVDISVSVGGAGTGVSGSGGGSKSLHFVRGHFVNRRNTIYWRSPHLRGDIQQGRVCTRRLSLR